MGRGVYFKVEGDDKWLNVRNPGRLGHGNTGDISLVLSSQPCSGLNGT